MTQFNFKEMFKARGFKQLLLLGTLNLVLIALFSYLAIRVYENYSSYTVLNTQKESLKQNALLVKNNADLLQDSILSYNNTLERLIPTEENYFRIISAFENLSAQTGIPINDYSINIDQTTDSKITFDFSIEGAPLAIEKFFNTYKYASGRYISISQVSFSFDEEKTTASLSLTLYNSPKATTQSTDIQIVNKNQIEKIEEIATLL